MGGMGFISANHAEILHNNALINLHTLEAARQQRRQALPLQLVRVHLSRVPPDRRQRHAAPRGGRLSRPSPRTPTAGRSWSPSSCAATTATSTGSRRASSASTTSSARTAPTTAAARRPRRRSAARSPTVESGGIDRDLGRRRADALVLLHRRLRRGHLPADAVGPSRAAQPRARTGWSASTSWRGSSSRSRARPASPSTTSPGPQGVRGRNSDNTRLREVLGWEPRIDLEEGLRPTYRWIEEQIRAGARDLVATR